MGRASRGKERRGGPWWESCVHTQPRVPGEGGLCCPGFGFFRGAVASRGGLGSILGEAVCPPHPSFQRCCKGNVPAAHSRGMGAWSYFGLGLKHLKKTPHPAHNEHGKIINTASDSLTPSASCLIKHIHLHSPFSLLYRWGSAGAAGCATCLRSCNLPGWEGLGQRKISPREGQRPSRVVLRKLPQSWTLQPGFRSPP